MAVTSFVATAVGTAVPRTTVAFDYLQYNVYYNITPINTGAPYAYCACDSKASTCGYTFPQNPGASTDMVCAGYDSCVGWCRKINYDGSGPYCRGWAWNGSCTLYNETNAPFSSPSSCGLNNNSNFTIGTFDQFLNPT